MKNKNVLIIISIFALLASIGIIIYIVVSNNKQNNLEDKPIIDNLSVIDNNDIFKETDVSGLKISNGSIATRDDVSTYSAIAKNETANDYKINSLYITFTIGDEEIKSLALYDTVIKQGEEKIIIINFDRNMSKVNKIDYVIE